MLMILPDSSSDVLLKDSLFYKGRLNEKNKKSGNVSPDDIDLSEEILNEFIANISISTVILNTWYQQNPVNITGLRNVYTFSSPLSIILPYSICLVLGLLCNILGLFSLAFNGETAEDGGFLQIMLNTQGDTEMNRVARTRRVKEKKVFEKELLDLRVRYGQLVRQVDSRDEDGERTELKILGFGTVNETVALRSKSRKRTMMQELS
jgi:hypothetical protein